MENLKVGDFVFWDYSYKKETRGIIIEQINSSLYKLHTQTGIIHVYNYELSMWVKYEKSKI